MLEEIGRYQIRGLIGPGDVDDVYRAYDPRFQRELAIKKLPTDLM